MNNIFEIYIVDIVFSIALNILKTHVAKFKI